MSDPVDHDPPVPYVPLSADAPPVADTPMWLSHHWPEDYDRCAVVAGRHVCRRCLVMYPIALAVAVLASVGWWWPRSLDVVLVPLLPVPAVVDFVVDNLRLARHSPSRQSVLTAVGALGAGAGFARYLDRPTDPLVWGTVLVLGGICLASVIVGRVRAGRDRGDGSDHGAVRGPSARP